MLSSPIQRTEAELSPSREFGSKIRDVRTVLLSVPLTPPIADSTHELRCVQWIIVELETSDGQISHSLMLTFGYGPELLQRIVDCELKRVIVGRDARDIAGIWRACYSHCEYIGQSGIAAWGIAAIEIALWDWLGKTLRVPVCQLFGACREAVPIYGSGGWLSYSTEELLAEVNGYLQRGFTAVKIKVGSPNITRDVERVRDVRKLIGDRVRLMVDANQAWSPLQAITFARQVADQNLFWLEEPISKDDIDGYCRVASTIDIPIATGEREYSLDAFRDLLVHQAASILQPDALRIGGLSQCMKVAHLAYAFGRPVAPHFYKEIDVHVVAAVPNGLYLEYFSWLDELLITPLRVANGLASVPKHPGLGLQLKPEAMREYQVRA
ncbi:MAG TPA: mandelate racemase/muconate lactonizing enzyme family protein [Terriglobales bacterium]|nr:mandelate racemase/muconate lactonizing enzyme family protein [Terriglobales bacterium]